MSDTEKAIIGMQGLKEVLPPLLLKINYEGLGKEDALELSEHLDLAIQSLREKAGRDKGCEFCRNGEKTEHIDNDSLIKFWIYKDKLVVAAEIGGERIEFARKIKFCFMCGRRLGGN